MKPLHLNLSSRPYRNDRPFVIALVALSALTAFLLFNNIVAATEYLANTRSTRQEIAAIERSIAVENQKGEIAERQIRSVNLKALNTQTSYINAQIAERAFSWTRLLDSLERTLPADVRLVSLNPTTDQKTGITRLQLDCVAKNAEGMVKMLRGLLADPMFRGAFPHTERLEPDGMYHFSITVEYLQNETLAVLR